MHSVNKKQKQRELAAEWDLLLSRHSKPLERGAKAKGSTTGKSRKGADTYTPWHGHERDTPRFASLQTPGGTTALAAPKKYTGTLIKGIATMHKSNAVPILNQEEAEDISRMRR